MNLSINKGLDGLKIVRVEKEGGGEREIIAINEYRMFVWFISTNLTVRGWCVFENRLFDVKINIRFSQGETTLLLSAK